jgi:HSP20 family molecular chaperone IbpA
VQDRGSRITEEADGYVIEAYAPAHEKDNLRMTIANNKAILSGKRKFQDSKEQEDKKISTNNFQTFHEEFKLGRAISTEGMTRERQGDYIKFFIPKLEAMNFDEES